MNFKFATMMVFSLISVLWMHYTFPVEMHGVGIMMCAMIQLLVLGLMKDY